MTAVNRYGHTGRSPRIASSKVGVAGGREISPANPYEAKEMGR